MKPIQFAVGALILTLTICDTTAALKLNSTTGYDFGIAANKVASN